MLGGMYLVIQGRNKRKCVPILAMISRLPLEIDSQLLFPCLNKWFLVHWNTCLSSSAVHLFALWRMETNIRALGWLWGC
jgi:hypothetical protein